MSRFLPALECRPGARLLQELGAALLDQAAKRQRPLPTWLAKNRDGVGISWKPECLINDLTTIEPDKTNGILVYSVFRSTPGAVHRLKHTKQIESRTDGRSPRRPNHANRLRAAPFGPDLNQFAPVGAGHPRGHALGAGVRYPRSTPVRLPILANTAAPPIRAPQSVISTSRRCALRRARRAAGRVRQTGVLPAPAARSAEARWWSANRVTAKARKPKALPPN